jgi:hypothetical protein
MPIEQIKILKGIAPILVGVRKKRNVYVTNRELKAFDLFVCLKATTTAGHIKNYPAQIKGLTKFCKCSKTTFYNRLHILQSMNIITVARKNIQLLSWEKVAELYELPAVEFHKINYDTDNKKQTVEYILKAVEVAENQQSQSEQALRKINKTSEIESAFKIHCISKNKTVDFSLLNLHAIQRETYSTGAANYDVLHAVNADINRSAKSIKKQYNFHSVRNVAYLKRQLETRGLANVTHRVAPVCRFSDFPKTENPKAKNTPTSIGAIIAFVMPNVSNVSSIKKGSKPKAYITFYSDKNNARIWRLPDSIELNKQLFTN